MPLTDTQIKNLKSPGTPKKYFDGGGLFLFASATGSRLWRMAYRFERRRKLLSFGEYPAKKTGKNSESTTKSFIKRGTWSKTLSFT